MGRRRRVRRRLVHGLGRPRRRDRRARRRHRRAVAAGRRRPALGRDPEGPAARPRRRGHRHPRHVRGSPSGTAPAEERLNGTLPTSTSGCSSGPATSSGRSRACAGRSTTASGVQAEERQQRAYAEALRDTASAMSKTLDVHEVMEQVLIGVERLVSNDLTAIVLVGADDQLEIARCRVGSATRPVSNAGADGAAGRFADRDRPLHDMESVIIDEPRCPRSRRLDARAALRMGDRRIGFVVLESVTRGSSPRPTPSGCGRSPTRRRRRSPTPGSSVRRASWPPPRSAAAVPGCTTPSTRRCGPRSPPTASCARSTSAPSCTGGCNDCAADERGPGGDAHAAARAAPASSSRSDCTSCSAVDRGDGVPQEDGGHGPPRARRPRRGDEVAFYRIAQEALTNITRHSGRRVDLAGSSEVTAAISLSGVELRIVDNGRGFDTTTCRRPPRPVDHEGAGQGRRR